jgi:hypothetical protein
MTRLVVVGCALALVVSFSLTYVAIATLCDDTRPDWA